MEDMVESGGANDSLTDVEKESLHISVNDLTGVENLRTMRITGYKQKKPLHILIDSGSTHKLLAIQLAPIYRWGWLMDLS